MHVKCTRKEYLNKKCGFWEYYEEVAELAGVHYDPCDSLVEIAMDALAKGDEYLNGDAGHPQLKLKAWDRRIGFISRKGFTPGTGLVSYKEDQEIQTRILRGTMNIHRAMNLKGDTWSVAGVTCTMKAALRKAVKETSC